jgi:hypothetical protein
MPARPNSYLLATLLIDREPIAFRVLKQHVIATICREFLSTSGFTTIFLNLQLDLRSHPSVSKYPSCGHVKRFDTTMTYLTDGLHTLRNISNHSFTSHADHSVDFMPISRLSLDNGAEETSGIGEVPLSMRQIRGSKIPRGKDGGIEFLMEAWVSSCVSSRERRITLQACTSLACIST